MDFVATFSTWADKEQPGMENATIGSQEFLVEASDQKQAFQYAKRFEGLETNVSEGLSKLISVEAATSRDKKLTQLSVYESGL